MLTGYGGFIGLGAILMIFGLYYGLWKMRKDWMGLVGFLLAVSTVIYIFYAIIEALDIVGMIIIVLNILSIYWFYSHRNLFIEPEKGKSTLGTKKEWKIIGIILITLVVIILISIFLINMMY